MVRIRLKRVGRRNRAMWRISICDQRSPRDGKMIEDIGHYNPHEADEARKVVIDAERARYWLSNGAQPSERVAVFLREKGIKT